jgi:hypothetical protein
MLAQRRRAFRRGSDETQYPLRRWSIMKIVGLLDAQPDERRSGRSNAETMLLSRLRGLWTVASGGC